MNLSGYKKHLTSGSAPAPLTFAEEELKLIKENDVGHSILGHIVDDFFFFKETVLIFFLLDFCSLCKHL